MHIAVHVSGKPVPVSDKPLAIIGTRHAGVHRETGTVSSENETSLPETGAGTSETRAGMSENGKASSETRAVLCKRIITVMQERERENYLCI